MNLYPIYVAVEYLAWQTVKKRHSHCAVIIAKIEDLYNAAANEKLNILINTDQNQIYLTIEKLQYFFDYSLSYRTIRDALTTLEKDNLIKRTDEYIIINFVALEDLKNKIRPILTTNYKFLPVFTFALRYKTENYNKTFIEYGLSKLVQNMLDGHFKKEMSLKYVHSMFAKLFTESQEATIFEKLEQDKILKKETIRSLNDESWKTKRVFELNMEKVKDLIKDHMSKVEKEQIKHSEQFEEAYDIKIDFDSKANITTKTTAPEWKRKHTYNNNSTRDLITSQIRTEEEENILREEYDELLKDIENGNAVYGEDYF